MWATLGASHASSATQSRPNNQPAKMSTQLWFVVHSPFKQSARVKARAKSVMLIVSIARSRLFQNIGMRATNHVRLCFVILRRAEMGPTRPHIFVLAMYGDSVRVPDHTVG